MSYSRTGEIGDIWKHLPLCDILAIEKPARYFDVFAEVPLVHIQRNPKTRYAVLRFFVSHDDIRLVDCRFARLVDRYTFVGGMQYLTSSGLALEILKNQTEFHFYSPEKKPLNEIKAFATTHGIDCPVNLHHSDALPMLQELSFTPNDFILVDSGMSANKESTDCFSIASQVLRQKAKLFFWYRYDSLSERSELRNQLNILAEESKIKLYCFDVWQEIMTQDNCPINPGVPGCGLALGNLSDESFLTTRRYLDFVRDCWQHSLFDGQEATLAVQTRIFG